MRIETIFLMVASVALFGCAGEVPSSTDEPSPAAKQAAEHGEEVTELPPLTIGNYEVHAQYEGPLKDGHFNFHVTGPEFAAIRQWVGPEDAAGVVVNRAEVLSDHIHAGVEMPDPIPADARLWIEFETPTGERLKGSVLLPQ